MVIMCLSCVIVGRFRWCHSLVTVLATSLILETLYLAHLCTCAPNVCNEILGQYDIFLNGSDFSFCLQLPLLPVWLVIEPSYFTQMYIDTRPKHTEITRLL